MTVSSTQVGSQRSARVPQLIRSLVSDLLLLLRREAELATIEIKGKTSEFAGAAVIVAGGAVAGMFALATLIAAAVLGLAIVMPAWAAALIVGLTLLIVAVVLIMIGRTRFRAAGPLAPTETIEAAKEDLEWIRNETAHPQTTRSE